MSKINWQNDNLSLDVEDQDKVELFRIIVKFGNVG